MTELTHIGTECVTQTARQVTGVIISAGTCPDTGMPRLIIETTEQQLRDLAVNPIGKLCRVELLDIAICQTAGQSAL